MSAHEKHCLVLYHGHYKSIWYTTVHGHVEDMKEMLDAAGVNYRYYAPNTGSVGRMSLRMDEVLHVATQEDECGWCDYGVGSCEHRA